MRIFYKATGFAEDVEVTAFFVRPDLVQSETYTLTHWGEGLYYLDIGFVNDGSYCGKFFEDGVAKTIKTFNTEPMYGAVTYRVRGVTEI